MADTISFIGVIVMMLRLLFVKLALCVAMLLHGQGMRFVENKGQWPQGVSHRAELPGAAIWCEQGAILLDLYDHEQVHRIHGNVRGDGMAEGPLRHHALRLRFLNAAGASPVTAVDPLPEQYNYFIGNDPAKWAGKARAYARLRMHGVAPGCDAVIQEGRGGLKYDLIVAPGADPNDIRFTYEGADAMEKLGDALVVRTSLGRLVERIPLAYQDIGGERRIITCRYTLENGVIGIEPETYDPAYELIIDPTLEFATFSGSVSNNFGYTATFDNAGFLYSGSTAFGNQYPVTLGAYQTTWAGGTTDIAISKYDTTGSFMVWSTYIGGSNSEMPHSLIVDANDQLVLLGTTGSSDYPTTANAYDQSFGGGASFNPEGLGLTYPNGSDMVVTRFNSTGSALLGSTFLGGSANDGLNSAPGLKFNYADEVRGEVLLGTGGRIWIVSTTGSDDMPTSPGAAQVTYGGGSHDGFVALFDPFLTQLQYGSYIGGGQADAVYNGDLDEQDRLFVCGGTTSTDLPIPSGSVATTYHGGIADAFVARFSADGTSIERWTYWGSSEYDQAYFVELDTEGDVYVFGQTSAPAGEMIMNAPYFLDGGGQFITKFDPDLSTVLLSSRIGSGDGDPDISPTAFLVDYCNKIYTSGWGSNIGFGGNLTTTGLPITADAHQTTTDGHDLYLAVFEIDMSALIYATYYGGPISHEHVDGGTSRFDRRGRVYQSVCAGCQNNDDFPTTPGAWSATNNSGGCNSAVLKFDFDAPLVIASFLAPDTICDGTTIPITNLSNGVQYEWLFGDGNGSAAISPVHTYAAPGTYTIHLTVYDPNSCNEVDSMSRTIVVAHGIPALEIVNDTLICGPAGEFELVATSNGTTDHYHWSSDPQFTDMLNDGTTDSTATIAPASSGVFHIQAGEIPLCSVRDSVVLIVQFSEPLLTGDSLICTNDTATLHLTGMPAGASILWQPEDEIISGQGASTALVAPLDNMVFGVAVSTAEGCSWSDQIGVAVSPLDGTTVSASVDQQMVIAGTLVQLNSHPLESVTHSWQPASLVSDPTIPAPTAIVDQTTTFIVTLSDGICTKDAAVTVTVYELVCEEPDIFVPNTFTPNGDGNNDLLFVRGRHITELEFMIFDRWGEKVFETRDQEVGWDGTFRGMDVDPAVFVYHLTVHCLDGQRYFTKGNITVVR